MLLWRLDTKPNRMLCHLCLPPRACDTASRSAIRRLLLPVRRTYPVGAGPDPALATARSTLPAQRPTLGTDVGLARRQGRQRATPALHWVSAQLARRGSGDLRLRSASRVTSLQSESNHHSTAQRDGAL